MEVVQAIRERRAINFFEEGFELPLDTLREIIEIANLAPSSYNLQPWEAALVAGRERKEALRKCAFNQAKVSEASAVVIIIAKPSAVEEHIDMVLDDMVRNGYIKNEDRENSRKPPFMLYGENESVARIIFAVKNAAFFAMNLMIAARSFGLETHPMDGFNSDAVKKEFLIPDDRIIPCIIAIGKLRSGLKLLPAKMRRKFEDFVSIDSYKPQGDG
jgi:nitroreductase